MEATEIAIKDILNCRSFPVVVVKYYEKDVFIMGYHVYQTAWASWIREELSIRGVMELTCHCCSNK